MSVLDKLSPRERRDRPGMGTPIPPQQLEEPSLFWASAHHTAAQHSACFLGNGTPIQRSQRMIDKGTFMTDFASVQKHLTAITSAQTDFAKSSFEANKAYFEKLAGVKSPDNFLELTTEYARSAQKTFVTEATKIGELYTAFAKEAFTPFTSNFLPK